MSKPFRIAVLGLGGVGGFVGGKLALHAASDGAEVIFFARGENAKAIRTDGLRLTTPQGTAVVRPTIVTDRPDHVGIVDLILCCVKSYDLEAAVATLGSCVNSKTVILPLLNGVDASSRIRDIRPMARVWDGCIYAVSQLTGPGAVTQTGAVNHLLFGSDRATGPELERARSAFSSAGIDVSLTGNATGAVWEKYIFLSPIATLASYLDKTIGQILENVEHSRLLLEMIGELQAVAIAKDVGLPASVVNDTLEKLKRMPYEAVPSMLGDFRKGRRTEVDTLTAYVTKLGRGLGVPTPRYNELAEALASRAREENPLPRIQSDL